MLSLTAKRNVAIFQIIAAVLLLVWFGGPLNLPIPTRQTIGLVILHVVAAATIVAVLSPLGRVSESAKSQTAWTSEGI